MEHHLNLNDFAFKRAFIIAYEEAEGLETFEDIDSTIESAKDGLGWIGLTEYSDYL